MVHILSNQSSGIDTNLTNANSHVTNVISHKYSCTAFYGSQILPFVNNCSIDDVYVAWRMTMHAVWRVAFMVL